LANNKSHFETKKAKSMSPHLSSKRTLLKFSTCRAPVIICAQNDVTKIVLSITVLQQQKEISRFFRKAFDLCCI
jgi:hypothetical protein